MTQTKERSLATEKLQSHGNLTFPLFTDITYLASYKTLSATHLIKRHLFNAKENGAIL
jgi:hypothetical protein